MKKSLLVLGITLLLTACGNQIAQETDAEQVEVEVAAETATETKKIEVIENKKVTTASGLQYEIFAPGNGAIAKAGDVVSVHYTGWITDGTKFDSSVDRGQPIEFLLGARQVIKGWDEGVEGMKVGEERRLTIPSSLAYGDQPRGKIIPAGATLIFDVELIDIVK